MHEILMTSSDGSGIFPSSGLEWIFEVTPDISRQPGAVYPRYPGSTRAAPNHLLKIL
jgi:hypothetical protein